MHRDVKPQNVLLLEGRWCLADFGIARYAEASTAPDTRKFAMSMPYAAPERWRGERATAAADVYSLGVIAHEVIVGALPFPGPSEHDFREQHLHAEPPPLPGATTRLASLVEECLFKAPQSRPTPTNLLVRLAKAGEVSHCPERAGWRLPIRRPSHEQARLRLLNRDSGRNKSAEGSWRPLRTRS